ITDFSSNINFVKPNVAMPENLDVLHAYNSDGYAVLKAAISDKYGVKPENIELYNGASAAIFSLFAHLKPKSVTLHAPIYSEYKKAAAIVGAQICNSGELSVFVNPSTPDGVLREITPHSQTIVDESFLDFTDGASLMGEAEDNKELYIVKSLTKYYGAAGVRVGFVASHGENIARLGASEPLWKLSSFDAYYMSEALKDGGFDGRSRTQNDANRELLRGVLDECGLFERVYDGKANFLLAKLRNINAQTLQTHLAKHKILVRNCANFDTLDDSYVRFAVKETRHIETLKEALCGL
ncbi:MAG TPA: aminotransferase class I/II-fold pyridoxal phosphate-dependent enzyme, partial [Campylobacterales bacterium]|nr:aminotransferase class I/II-fold pyridoxal phosphate-dependent enzyme [Campylobacterales bacterium]